MKTKTFLIMVLLLVVTSCVRAGYPTVGISTTVSENPKESGSQTPIVTSTDSTATPSAPSEPIYTPTATPSASSELILTPTTTLTALSQPIYDPSYIGELSDLDSYVVISQRDNQKGADPNGGEGQRISQYKLTVIHEPRQAHLISSYEASKIIDVPDQEYADNWYWVEDVIYLQTEGLDYWTIKPEDEDDRYYFNLFANEFAKIKNARFVGLEDFHGVPTNHFVFDQTDWVNESTQNWSVQGNIYLAQGGNYPLHLDYQQIGNVWWEKQDDTNDLTYLPGISDVVYDISSINQVMEIVLPEDVPLQVKLDADVPLPADAKLLDIMVFKHGPPYDYDYQTDLSDDEIIAFYQAFQPTNGWSLNTASKDPGGNGGIVVLNKNDHQVILNFSFNKYSQIKTISFQYSP